MEEVWGAARADLRSRLGAEAFAAWIEKLRFREIDGRTAHFEVPMTFIGTYVERTYGDAIRTSISGRGCPVERLQFTVRHVEEPAPKAAPAVVVDDAGMPSSPLDPNNRFDSFVVGKANEMAYAAARRVADADPGQPAFNPLYIHGGGRPGEDPSHACRRMGDPGPEAGLPGPVPLGPSSLRPASCKPSAQNRPFRLKNNAARSTC